MRRRVLLSWIWACPLLAACGPTSFKSELRGETTVPAGMPGAITQLNAFPAIGSFVGLDFNENQDFKNQDVTKDEVDSVRLQSLEMRLLSPSDVDFGFLDTLEFFAKAGDLEVRIARRRDISQLGLRAPNPVLRMDVDDEELQPFIAAPAMSILVRGKGRLPEQEVRLQAVVLLGVEVNFF
ncbi:hypothetical protein [Stigmatella aurantiaca]|uniref:Lipoprotein n=1 Tax=Stigmatella aurantiaca (strain DW4/3-1) TaxID=378806 RepID=Q08NZ9_STIAD|nr:hypothetical protein [Stigmatella aurantiaca]EAU62198.1 hypothetical protein STIAU_3621 [Stigmatella aurantiaca DW4/3-1]